MEIWSQAVWFGAWFGLLHAFDADHLATIGGLAVHDRSLPPTGYALRWALGHAAAIGLVATAVLGLDSAGILDWTAYAEVLVCLALFVLGVQALRAARRSARAAAAPRVAVHTHLQGIAHAHVHFLAPWHSHARGGPTSLVMGLLHGGAGSAAVLAVLPLTQLQSGFTRALYLACFSLGVALGALAFARLFASLAHRSTTAGDRLAAAFQAAVGVVAIASGALLLFGIAHGGA